MTDDALRISGQEVMFGDVVEEVSVTGSSVGSTRLVQDGRQVGDGMAWARAAANTHDDPSCVLGLVDESGERLGQCDDHLKGLLVGQGARAAPLEPESDFGNVEYKLVLNPSPSRLVQLTTQMKFRLSEGGGEAIYEIGVADDGQPVGLCDADLEASLATLRKMALELQAEVTVLRECEGQEGRIAEVLVRKLAREELCEIRVSVVGNVDAGKSTLLAVLSHGQLDDGRGLARMGMLQHKHEFVRGQSSSIAHEILGFDSKGEVVNYRRGLRVPSWPEICEQASKVVMFNDLAGHRRYLGTTLYGLTGQAPDFCMLAIAANDGPTGMTKEHLGCALGLRVPTFVVVTKTDMVPPRVLKRTRKEVARLIKSPCVGRIPVAVRDHDDVVVAARHFLVSEKICPIFLVSSVTGDNLDLLRAFINLLPSRTDWDRLVHDPVEFQIEQTFSVTGVGTVAGGVVTAGTIVAGTPLLLGPNAHGEFSPVAVKSIQAKRRNVRAVAAGQTASLALKRVPRDAVHKGMVLVDMDAAPVAVMDFEAEMMVFAGGAKRATVALNHEAVVHSGAARATARIIYVDREDFGAPDVPPETVARVVFRFLYKPQYLKEGARLLFREGHVKGVGRITRLFPDGFDPDAPTPAQVTTTHSPRHEDEADEADGDGDGSHDNDLLEEVVV